MKKVLLLFTMFFVGISMSFAQKTVTGTVLDNEGLPIIGANVLIEGTSEGTVTDIDGAFSLDVPSGAETLILSYTGYETQELDITNTSNLGTLTLLEGEVLDEIVITGVGKGTSTKKLGFAVSKINEEQLEEVPGLDPGNALRGKAPGVRVVQASGNPSYGAEIRLRGSTSISGNQRPLIIVDGIITEGDLRDINMDDVESMEVVKGAAASALYGSLAGNGVIQIITKTGNSDGNGMRVTLKNEYGFSSLNGSYPIATKHRFLNDSLGQVRNGDWNGDGTESSNYGFGLDDGGSIVDDPDGIFDNDFLAPTFDNIDRFMSGASFYNNNISIATTDKTTNYMLSFSNQVSGGIVDILPNYKRRNFRANIDSRPSDKFKISFRSSYGITDGVDVTEQGQGENLFFNLLTSDPYIDLEDGVTTDEDGNQVYNPQPAGVEISATNAENALYLGSELDWGFDRTRFLGGVSAQYSILDGLTAELAYTLDKTNEEGFFQRPKSFFDQSVGANVNGSLFLNDREINKSVASAQLQYDTQLGDRLNGVFTLKYLYEDLTDERLNVGGTEVWASNLRTIDNVSLQSGGSFMLQEIAENVFFDVQLDFDDKLILGGMIRNDGSSSFGANERNQWYYRGSAAYRISEDMNSTSIDEWKVRASYGTSGLRPPFAAQYEVYPVSQSGISGLGFTRGNADLKPSTVTELEIGTNIAFLKRFNLEVNYATTKTTNDYIQVPLSALSGFQFQWQNIGEVSGTAIELGLSADIITQPKFSWTANIFWDRITQEITNLNGVAPFIRNTATAFDLFRVEEGLPFGAMYGNKIVTSVDELSLDSEGNVLNATSSDLGRPLRTDDFYVNEDGYLIAMIADENGNPIEAHGTPLEQVVYLADENGERVPTLIGDTNPDWNLGFSSTFKFGGLSLYVLLDHQQGGDIYNYTKQLLYFNDRHQDLQDDGAIGKHSFYKNGSSQIYNGASASSHFVEDGTFTKLREVSLGYTFNKGRLGSLGNIFNSLKVALTGRNLITITNYSGWDPEVALRNNPSNFRFDEYSYPNYRTFTGSLTIEF